MQLGYSLLHPLPWETHCDLGYTLWLYHQVTTHKLIWCLIYLGLIRLQIEFKPAVFLAHISLFRNSVHTDLEHSNIKHFAADPAETCLIDINWSVNCLRQCFNVCQTQFVTSLKQNSKFRPILCVKFQWVNGCFVCWNISAQPSVVFSS